MTKGARIEDLETPALLLDMTTMEANLAKMSCFFQDKTARLRPHFKNHRSPLLARKQLEAGAIGFTCARLREVEVLVQYGFQKLLVANEIVSAGKLRRILELARNADIILAVDAPTAIDVLAGLARETGVQPNVVVDVDLGLHRCGVAGPDEAASLAQACLEKGLRVRGVMGYEGHLQLLPPGPEKEAAVNAACRLLIEAKEAVERCGCPVEIVSMAGTGSYSIAAKYPGITEVQCGSFLVMDTGYAPFAPNLPRRCPFWPR